ncbi:MAG: Cys-tRNA(Pro) deacylase [Clostridia bacterium]|nr:Cys-tRNA(Pro) deacylase [Clostridia bacterium]
MSKIEKTNAMRRLDAAKIAYQPLTYEVDENDLSGVHIADQVGLPYARMFKTLVAHGDKTGPLVFCLPVDREIDLRRAAALTGNKRIEMVAVKDLLALTGYVRGGCSPIGMKKRFPTYLHASALDFDEITVSAGCKGIQLLLSREKLIEHLGAQTAFFAANDP